MPQFIIDEVYVGDIVGGEAVFRDVSIDGAYPEPIRTLPYFLEESDSGALPIR